MEDVEVRSLLIVFPFGMNSWWTILYESKIFHSDSSLLLCKRTSVSEETILISTPTTSVLSVDRAINITSRLLCVYLSLIHILMFILIENYVKYDWIEYNEVRSNGDGSSNGEKLVTRASLQYGLYISLQLTPYVMWVAKAYCPKSINVHKHVINRNL